MAFGDLDHDGHADLVGIDATNQQLAIMSNGGTQYTTFPSTGSIATDSITVAELDGLPGDDLAFTYTNQNSVIGVIHGGTALGALADVSIAACPYGVVQSGNLSGGKLGALVLYCQDHVQILQATGGGAFTPGLSWSVTAPEKLVGGSALVADFDGDGDLDVVVMHSFTNGAMTEIVVLQNDGRGTLVPVPAPVSVTLEPTSALTVGDVNDDGKPDVVVADRKFGSTVPLTVLLNVSP